MVDVALVQNLVTEKLKSSSGSYRNGTLASRERNSISTILMWFPNTNLNFVRKSFVVEHPCWTITPFPTNFFWRFWRVLLLLLLVLLLFHPLARRSVYGGWCCKWRLILEVSKQTRWTSFDLNMQQQHTYIHYGHCVSHRNFPLYFARARTLVIRFPFIGLTRCVGFGVLIDSRPWEAHDVYVCKCKLFVCCFFFSFFLIREYVMRIPC